MASTASPENLHLVIVFRLPVLVDAEEAAVLSGTLALEVPLGEFRVEEEGWVQLAPRAGADTTGILRVDSASTITPFSEAARAALEAHMMQGVRSALLCAVLNSIPGPFSTVITAVVLTILAAANPSASDLDIPIAETSDPLPGSDKVVDVELTEATIRPGLLTAQGRLRLITDPDHVYAYLRVVERMGRLLRFPVPGINVALYELDDPAPEGDDVAVPETGEWEETTQKYVTTTEVEYSPHADQLLGTQVTDESGRVTFVVKANSTGGMKTTTTTREQISTGKIKGESHHVLVPEVAPDLAVTITSPTGELLAQRRLVGLNVAARRLGSFDHPVEVTVRRTPVIGPPTRNGGP